MYFKKFLFIILFCLTFVLFIANSYVSFAAENNDKWNVSLKSNSVDFTDDSMEIEFEIEENENVSKGKIAPGMKAKANISLELSGTRYPVDLKIETEEKLSNKDFEIIYMIDGKEYELGTTNVIMPENNEYFTDEDGTKNIEIELKWLESGTYSKDIDKITLPIKITVEQHI